MSTPEERMHDAAEALVQCMIENGIPVVAIPFDIDGQRFTVTARDIDDPNAKLYDPRIPSDR